MDKRDKDILVLKSKDCNNLPYNFRSAYDRETISNDLHSMQSIVGGLIEPLTFATCFINGHHYTIDLVCNEEGKLENLPTRALIVYDMQENVIDTINGDYFIAVCDQDNGEYINMSETVVSFLEKHHVMVDCSFPNGQKITCPAFFIEEFYDFKEI